MHCPQKLIWSSDPCGGRQRCDKAGVAGLRTDTRSDHLGGLHRSRSVDRAWPCLQGQLCRPFCFQNLAKPGPVAADTLAARSSRPGSPCWGQKLDRASLWRGLIRVSLSESGPETDHPPRCPQTARSLSAVRSLSHETGV